MAPVVNGRGNHWLAAALCAGTLLVAGGRAAAQALPFHAPTALTTSFEQRGVRAWAQYERRGDLTVLSLPVVLLPYAPHERLTVSVGMPFLYKRLRNGPSVAGPGDVDLSLKWAFFVRDRPAGTSRLALLVAGRFPTASTDAVLFNGSPAPREFQLGSGAVALGAGIAGTILRGRWGGVASVRHTRFLRDDGFLAGARTLYDLALGFRIPDRVRDLRSRTLQLYVEVNGAVVGRAERAGAVLPNTGGHVVYVSPGAQWVLLPQFLVEGSVQFPVVRKRHGVQPAPSLRPGLGVRVLFF